MVNNKKKIFRLSKQAILLGSAISLLLFLAWFLQGRISRITKENTRNLATLNEVLPGFNEKVLKELKEDINSLEAELLALAYVFDPPQRQAKKDYDLPIYFVEELSKVKQSLKTKAADKRLSYPELGFKEALPDEKEARYLLKQLSVINEVVSRGMDAGVNFDSVKPQPIEDLSILPGIKRIKIRMEFAAQAAALVDFFIRLSEIVPLDSVESLLVKTEDSVLEGEIIISYIVIEADWKDKPVSFSPLNLKEIFLEETKAINSLRANNPFYVVKVPESAGSSAKPAAEQPKQSPRFLYQGKAVLRGKEVAVVEDTLNQETIFLAPGDRTGDFTLKELKELEIILKNINTGQETVVKRQQEE